MIAAIKKVVSNIYPILLGTTFLMLSKYLPVITAGDKAVVMSLFGTGLALVIIGIIYIIDTLLGNYIVRKLKEIEAKDDR